MFHMTVGGLTNGDCAGDVALKLNGRFPPGAASNSQRVNGAVLVSDAGTGRPLALLDSKVITSLRTAAITTVVTRLLARVDASTALLIGAGRQGRGQVEALAHAGIRHLLTCDLVAENAIAIAAYARALGLEATVVDDVHSAARASGVIVTITPAREPILDLDDIRPGALVIALGADGPGKQELDPRLVASSRVVVDLLDQAAESGELQHTLALGLMQPRDVHAELGEILAGIRPGRVDDEEIFVFDGTGTALQDLAAARVLIDEAGRRGVGTEINLEA
jgi:alanine dehydrogenase